MAISRVSINHNAIRTRLQTSPLGGTSARTRRGAGGAEAIRIAERMALQARINADARFEQRTSSLVLSVRSVVREGRGGDVEVGVATTVEHGYWLEEGTQGHVIEPQVPFQGPGKGGYLLVSGGPRGKGPNPNPLDRPRRYVLHPGNQASHWMSDAVRAVIPGALVRVRKLF